MMIIAHTDWAFPVSSPSHIESGVQQTIDVRGGGFCGRLSLFQARRLSDMLKALRPPEYQGSWTLGSDLAHGISALDHDPWQPPRGVMGLLPPCH